MGKRLEIASPAKINLFLRVCGKRPDGYHEIESLMCPVTLADAVSLELGGEGVSIQCPAPGVPEDMSNLACRAAALFFEQWGRPEGLRIGIDKVIPAGAGLGGGSSNAAAVLKGLNSLTGSPFSVDELAEMGARIGSDVPFFVHGRPALVTGIGEGVAPVAGMYAHHLVIVFPGLGASTARVYKKCNLALTRCKKIHSVPDLTGDPAFIEGLLCNDLEWPAMQEYPYIQAVKEALTRTGPAGVLMSGSGSSVFALFRTQSGADRAKGLVMQENNAWQAFVCQVAA